MDELGVLGWIRLTFKRWNDFSGRSRRTEYWLFTLSITVVLILLGVIGSARGNTGLLIAGGIFVLIVFIPQMAVTVRRLHDSGKSGLWYLLTFLGGIGSIALIVLCLLDGDPGRNRYGPNPRNTRGDVDDGYPPPAR